MFAVPCAAGDVYRCTEDGKTVYSDRPCRSGASKTVPVPSSEAGAAAGAPASTPQNEANLGRIAPGQTPAQVEQAWGRPKTRNIDTSKSGRSEQWVYDRPNSTGYVYFRDGVVSSYSTHLEREKASSEPARQPSRADLEAQERAEKAKERRFVSDNSRLSRDQVRERLGEPDNKSFANGAEIWIYRPDLGDPATETRISFDIYSGELIRLDRTIRR